jgi:hypothetical protein
LVSSLGSHEENVHNREELPKMANELYQSMMEISTEGALLKELITFSENLGFNQACAFMTIRKTGTAQAAAKIVDN